MGSVVASVSSSLGPFDFYISSSLERRSEQTRLFRRYMQTPYSVTYSKLWNTLAYVGAQEQNVLGGLGSFVKAGVCLNCGKPDMPSW